MNVKINNVYLPAVILTEDVEKIALMKAVLRSFTNDHERMLLSIQRRLKDGKDKIDFCTRKFNTIELQLNAVETQISEALLVSQEAEIEAFKTFKENKAIKRKIRALKNDIEEQRHLVKRASETIEAVRKSSLKNRKKPRLLLPKSPL